MVMFALPYNVMTGGVASATVTVRFWVAAWFPELSVTSYDMIYVASVVVSTVPVTTTLSVMLPSTLSVAV